MSRWFKKRDDDHHHDGGDNVDTEALAATATATAAAAAAATASSSSPTSEKPPQAKSSGHDAARPTSATAARRQNTTGGGADGGDDDDDDQQDVVDDTSSGDSPKRNRPKRRASGGTAAAPAVVAHSEKARVQLVDGDAARAASSDEPAGGATLPRRRTTAGSALEGRSLQRSLTSLMQPERPLAPPPSTVRSLINIAKYTPLNVLLLLIPVSWALHFSHQGDLAIFITSFIAIMPLAALLSMATEDLSLRIGQTLGGLLNATLGNVVELIVAVIALFHCEITITQTSLIGSILSNILLVLGSSFIIGGVRYQEQSFGLTAAQLNISLLTMAVFAILVPASFHATLGSIPDDRERADILKISRGTAVILLLIYVAVLYFQLSSHKHLYADPEADDDDEEEQPQLSVPVAAGLLLVATVLVGVTSEWLVESLDGFSSQYGVPKSWLGLILLPIVSNAAEHVTALVAAHRDKMDLAQAVAVGSAIQIALFVLPLLVVISWIANRTLTLLFDPFVSIILFLSVLLTAYALADGRSNYLEGVLLVCVFVIIGLSSWFIDDSAQGMLFTDGLCKL